MRRVAGIATLIALTLACAPSVERPPNVLMILVDDLGWADSGVYGSSFYETPNIDRLAADGMRFTQFSAASPVCSPTRASIITGKHPARLNITNWISGEADGLLLQADYERQLGLEELTLGEAFAEAGYATGYIGKWHLGAGAFRPEHQGFGASIAVNDAGQPASYHYPYRGASPSPQDVPDLEDGTSGEYLTDRLTDEAIDFMEAQQEKPFLLVLSHYAVHTPLQAAPGAVATYEQRLRSLGLDGQTPYGTEHDRATTRLRQDHAVYAAMVNSTDTSVGRLLAALEHLGLESETIVVFVSDNGGLSTLAGERTGAPTSNLPLRAGKGWLYEGGLRVPLIVRWPGHIAAGSTSSLAAVTTDLYPTLLDLAGLPLRPEQHQDGRSLADVVRERRAEPRAPLFWHFPHYHGSGSRPSGAVRAGELKLIEWFETGTVELYDLTNDPGEADDLAVRRPETARQLQLQLRAWRAEVDAQMPRSRD